jgi:HD-GYP domain-containing protein (c-di-GMP phosphodiesterase class II)
MSLGELIAIFALGQDNAFGQPLESQMRSTLLATWMTEASGLPASVRDTTYWVAQLRYIGCTGHAHEVAVMFGDEIETRARSLLYDAANPVEVLRDALTHGHPEQRGFARLGAVVSILAGGRKFAEINFRTGCEVAEAIAGRLGLDQSVREALRCSFERWNGKGQPNGVKGEHIPLPMRIVHLTHDLEALARLCSPADALRVVRQRSGRAYDPAVVAEFLGLAGDLLAQLEKVDPWETVLTLEPLPRQMLSGESLLTRAEFDRVELHPLLTEQMLRRSPALAQLCPVAACHHERADGSGYVKGLVAAQMSLPARILAAADRYQAMTQPRAHRPALSPEAAAAELRRMAVDGQVDRDSAEWVLSAAGHQAKKLAGTRPCGLTDREVVVLELVARGLTTKAIAQRLVISPKTADTHIQHIYAKIGTTTRGAAALFAMQHNLVH